MAGGSVYTLEQKMVFSIFAFKLPQLQVEQPQTLEEYLETAKRVIARCTVYFDPSPYLTFKVEVELILPNTEISSLAKITNELLEATCTS